MDQSRMSVDVNLTVPATAAEGTHTPNTPEILNSIVTMQQQTEGPFVFNRDVSVTSIAESLSQSSSQV